MAAKELALTLPDTQGFGGFGVAVKLRIDGLAETLAVLRELGPVLGFRVVEKAVRAGAAPIVKAARRNAPRRKGHLRRAITQKLKRYRGQKKVLSIVGPRIEKLEDGENPGVYGHLPEGGTKAHLIIARNKAFLVFKNAAGRLVRVKQVMHPGTKALRYLARAVTGAQSESIAKFKDKLTAETYREAAKVARK